MKAKERSPKYSVSIFYHLLSSYIIIICSSNSSINIKWTVRISSFFLSPGPHNLKVCLAYKEVGKCACLYKSSKFALFFTNVPAEWTFSRCALQIICRMLRIVEVCLSP
jgi:hypothetical protein